MLKKFYRVVLNSLVAGLVLPVLFSLSSCGEDAGLGSTVDTESPNLTISYPQNASVVKGTFLFAGSATDDKGLASVTITVTDSDKKQICTETVAPGEKGLWSVKLNKFDPENTSYYNGWQFADGTYEISAVAKDNAGRTSGVSSKTLTIDNTAPVLVLTKPTSVGSGTAKAYGQTVQLEGTVSEMSDGTKFNLTVHFFDEKGNFLFNSEFPNLIDMSGANPLTIAQYYPEKSRPQNESDANWQKWQSYLSLYGEEGVKAYENGENPASKAFYFTVTVTDNAKTYLDSSDEGVEGGNATSTYYRGTTEMLKLIEGKTIDGFSVLSLRNYLNKTDSSYTENESTQSAIEEILAAAVSQSPSTEVSSISDYIKNNETSAGAVYLNFQVNPKNNPTYAVSGYTIDAEKADSESYSAGYRKYYTGSSLSINIAPGLDETNLDTSTVSLFVRDTASSDSADNILVWTWNEAVAIKYAMTVYSLTEEVAKSRIQALTASSETYRYTPTSSSENTDSLSITTTLDDGLVSGKTYEFIIAGQDIDNQSIVGAATAGYGIWASMVADPPVVSFGDTDSENYVNIADDSVINSAVLSGEKRLTFSGTVSTYVQLSDAEGLSYSLNFVDPSDSSKTLAITGVPEEITQRETASPYVFDWKIRLTGESLSESVFSLLETEGRYKLTVTVTAKSSGGTSKESRAIIIDTKAPSVRNLAVSHSVSDSLSVNGDSILVSYITGKESSYTVSGTSSDNYELASTTYRIRGKSADGEKVLSGQIKTTEAWSIPVDFSDFIEDSESDLDITLEVMAADAAGNISSPVYLYIILDSTAPVLTEDKIGSKVYSESDEIIWQNTNILGVSGTIEEKGAGVEAVYYKVDSGSEGSMTATNYKSVGEIIFTTDSGENEEFSKSLSSFKDGTNTLSYIIVDKLGNVSELYTRLISTDTNVPKIDAGTLETSYVKTAENQSFSFTTNDRLGGSGIQPSSFKITIDDYEISSSNTTYGKISYVKTEGNSVSPETYEVTVTLTAALNEKLSENSLYSVSAVVLDVAGNSSTKQIGLLGLDKTAPSVQIAAASGTNLYVRDKRTLSLSINDTGTVKSAGWAVFLYNADPATYDSTEPLASGEFTFEANTSLSLTLPLDISGISALTDGKSFVVCVKASDKPGNDSSYSAGLSSVYTVDKQKPVMTSDLINESEYVSGSSNWYNSQSLSVSGTWRETGSGIAAIYYQLISDGSSASVMTSENYDEVKTGIIYTTDNGDTESYSTIIKNFTVSSQANKLYYVAVDTVGNASDVIAHDIYVDSVQPTISEETAGSFTKTLTANGKKALSNLTFYAADTASGIDTGSVSVTIGENTISNANGGDNSTYGTLTVGSNDSGKYLVTLSISGEQAQALVSESNASRLSSGSSYSVNALVYDKAGNAKTTSIRTLKIDTEAPDVNVTQVDDSNRFIKDKKSVTVNVSDTGSLSNIEYAIFASSDSAFASPLKTVTAAEDSVLEISDTSVAAVSKTFIIDISDIDSLTDGTSFIVCVRATDGADNRSDWSKGKSSLYTVDKEGPVLSFDKLADEDYDDSKWYNATTLTAGGAWTDSGSGANTLYYVLSSTDLTNPTASDIANHADKKTAAIGSDGSYTVNISGFASNGTSYLYYIASDAVGNYSEVKEHSVKVDVDKPAFTGGNTETTTKKSGDTAEFTVTISDGEGSGLNAGKLVATIGSYSIYADDSVSDYNKYGTISNNNGEIALSVNSDLINNLVEYKLNSVNVTAYDNAGNYDSSTIGYLKVDNHAPEVKITQEGGTNLFVGAAAKNVTATISDIGDIQSVDWAVFAYYETETTYDSDTPLDSGNAYTRTESSTDTGTSATITATFSDSKYADGSKYVICVKARDAAGNESLYSSGLSSIYTVDKNKPRLSNDLIGGIKYVETDKNWFSTTSTLSVSGKWIDTDANAASGSGVKTLYYQLNGTDPLTSENYANSGIATQVAVTDNDYDTNIKGFVTGENTLRYVALDYAGNVSEGVKRTVWVDNTAPLVSELASDDTNYKQFSSTTAMGKVNDIDLYFTVSDADSGLGISSSTSGSTTTYTIGTVVKASVNSKEISSENTTYGNLEITGSSGSVYTVKLSLNAAELAGGDTPVLANGSAYGVNVILTDVAGNETRQSVGTLSIDVTPPDVTVTPGSGIDLYASAGGSKSVTAGFTDANGIASYQYAVFAVTDTELSSALRVFDVVSTTETSASLTAALSEFNFGDGDKFVIGVKATDSLGNESAYIPSSVYTIDDKAPVFSSSAAGANAKQVGLSASSLKAYDAENWFKETSLAVAGSWTEAGSGIKAVYYEVVAPGSVRTIAQSNYADFSSFSTAKQPGGFENFSTNLSGFGAGTNTVYLISVDNVGNVSGIAEYTVKVDTAAPEFVNGDFDDSELTNGSEGSTTKFKFTITDANAGISVADDAVSVTVGTLSDRKVTNGSSTDTSDYGSVTVDETATSGTYEVTAILKTDAILADQSGSTYAINATITDKAGNTASRTVHYLSVDKINPELTITSPAAGATVNKTISLSGSATDASDIASITVKAVSGTNANGIEKSYNYSATTSDENTVKLSGGTWSAYLNTSALYNNTTDANSDTLTLTVTATDKAGNSSQKTQTATIDQLSDRPEITINGLTKINGAYVLQLGKNAQISGTVTDDDATSAAKVKTFIVSDEEITSDSTSGETSYTATTGKWSFTPSDKSDGTKNIYFYIVDNGVDESNNDTGIFYTGASTSLVLPVLLVGSDSVSTDQAFSYNSDSVAPVVTQPFLNYSADGVSASNTENDVVVPLSVSTSVYVGGANRPQVQFIVSASDANKIAGFTLELGNTSANLATKKYSYGKETLAQVSSVDFSSYTESGAAVTSDTTTEWTTGFIDLSGFASHTGAVNLNIVAYDNSGMSGIGSYTFMLDNHGPEISISSPVQTAEQNSTNVSITGILTDVGLAGPEIVKYGIPRLGASSIAEGEWLGTVDTTGSWNFSISDFATNYLVRTDASGNSSDSAVQNYAVEKISGSVENGTDIWKVPVYFLAIDKNGNKSEQKTDYYITFNPNADLPITTITYPNSESYKSETEQYAPLGGKINAQGTVNFASTYSVGESGAANLSAVYIQLGVIEFDENDKISTVNWDYTSEEFTKAINLPGDGLTAVTAAGLASSLGKASYSDLKFADTSDVYSYGEKWWGIKADGSAFGTATNSVNWKLVLNSNNGLNITDTTTENEGINRLAIRACGVNSNGKVGSWDGEYYIYVDNGYPTQSVSLKQFKDYPSTNGGVTGDQLFDAKADSERTWTSDMFVRNTNADWYLVVYAYDSNGINDAETTASVVVSSVTTSLTDKILRHAETSGSGDTAITNYYYYIPLNTETGSGTYSLSVTDADKEGSHTTPMKYAINIDNTAPEMTELIDTSSAAIAYTKLKNSNYGVQFGATTTDDSSGVSRIAYYFKRGESGGTQTIELPVPELSGSASPSNLGDVTAKSNSDKRLVMTVEAYPVEGSMSGEKVAVSGDSDDKSGLYGIWLSNATRGSESTFTQDYVSDYAEKGLIRVGGIALIGGAYRTIVSVSDDTVTFAEEIPVSFDRAFFAMAFIVDNSEGFSNASGIETITNDDGDGVAESIKKGTYKWEWQSKFFSDELDDGVVYIGCTSFDKAENTRHSETKVMIANNTPRLTKVFLATDLNGDNEYADSEFVSSSVYISRNSETSLDSATKSYLAALTSAEEDVTSIVTTGAMGDWKDYNGETTLDSKYFRISGSSVLTFEFVSGVEGYGSGNNGLTAYMSVGDSALTAPEHDGTRSIGDLATIESETITWNDASKEGIEIASEKLYNNSAVSTYGTYSESTGTGGDVAQYLSLTLWDKTTGTTVGTADSNIGTENAVFGSQYTVLNIPVYFDFEDDVMPSPTFKDPTVHSDGGHIELSSTLPTVTFAQTSGEYDRDTKISGTVVFTGTVSDEKRISSITLTSGKAINNTLTSAVEVASYVNGLLKVTDAASATTGWKFLINEATADEQFSVTDGHKVTWTLTLDSSYVENVAASDVLFTLTASDGTNGADATYQVDIVPYITGIWRSESETNKSKSVVLKTYRSTYGEYPVAIGDTLNVTGYNLPNGNVADNAEGTYVHVGSTGVATTNVTANKQFTFLVPENSGELTVSVSDILSLNHLNNNANENNQETAESVKDNAKSSTVKGNVLYDNRYLRVWDVGHYFSNSPDGSKPTMATDNAGNIFSTWTLMGSATVQIQKGLKTSNKPLYVHYDQPDKESWLAVDKTPGTSNGEISVMYFPANVGWSGTPDTTGYAQAEVMGGVWGAGIPNANFNDQNYFRYGNFANPVNENGKRKYVWIAGNPYTYVDSKVVVGGWQLASASMRREVSQFTNARTVRKGDAMHFAYYDTKNQALRYTYQANNATPGAYNSQNNSGSNTTYKKAISGWILVDGSSDGQDRIHGGYEVLNGSDSANSIYNNITSNSVTLITASTALKNKNCTVGIAYTDSAGKYHLDLHEATGDANGQVLTFTDGSTTAVSIDGNTDGSFKCMGGCVYYGDSNVVSKGATQIDSVGAHLSLDVTSTGKPVVVYYDSDNDTLRIAYSTSATPSMSAKATGADTFTRQSLKDIITGGTYVQAKIDPNNYLHILYRDDEGQLKYVKSANAPDGAAYTINKKDIMTVDTSGTYGTLSLIRSGTGTYTYTPCVSWLNSEGTANGVKYAVLRTVDQGAAATSADDGTVTLNELQETSLWDTMIVPAVKGNFVTGGEYIYTEGFNGWTANSSDVTDSVNTADCDAIIGYNTGRMDVLFLKSEK